MAWIPNIGRMDAASGSTFKAFDTYVRQPDGSERLTTISSLHQLRSIERDSEQRQRNGEGQALRWRDYSNDRSNGDRNSFGPTPAEQTRADLGHARATLSAGRHREEPTVTLGPGVTDDTVSPLT